MKVLNLLKTNKLLHNKIGKSLILFISLGLSSLTFANNTTWIETNETAQSKTNSVLSISDSISTENSNITTSHDVNYFSVIPCAVKLNDKDAVKCHYMLNENEYKYEFDLNSSLLSQMKENIDEVRSQPLKRLIAENIYYFNLFYSMDDIDTSLNYIGNEFKLYQNQDDINLRLSAHDITKELTTNQYAVSVDGYKFIDKDSNNNSNIINTEDYKFTFIQDAHKTNLFIKPDKISLNDFFNLVFDNLSKNDIYDNTKIIERYFNTIQFHYHDNMTPVNLSQYYERPANFKSEAVLDKIVLPKYFDNEPQKVVINEDLKKIGKGINGMFTGLLILSVLFVISKIVSHVKNETRAPVFPKVESDFASIENIPDLSEIENLIQKVESIKQDFKNIKYDYELDDTLSVMFNNINLLKESVYSNFNEINWKENKNSDIVKEFQSVIDSYIESMNSEYLKIKERFDVILKGKMTEKLDNIKIIQDLQ